jgi:hypothetical protein
VEGRRHRPAVVAEYRSRLDRHRAAAAALDRRHVAFGNVRLGLLAAFVALAVVAYRSPAVEGFWLVVPAAAFAAIAWRHGLTLNARERAARAVAVYERGLARLEDRWAGTGESGERFRKAGHPFADDLDLFGRGSLFDLLSGPRTRGGEEVLAGWLLAPSPVASLLERQQAVDEMATRLDLREDLATLGPDVRVGVDREVLVAWALAPARLTSTWPRLVLPLLAVASTSLVVWWVATGVPPAGVVPLLAAQGLVAWRYRSRATALAKAVERHGRDLTLLSTLLARIEREPVTSPRLARLREMLEASGHRPSAEIARLARLVDVLTSRRNQIFAPIAALWLIGTQTAFAVDAWRRRVGPAVPGWLDAVAEFEAIVALATYRYEHPEDPFPTLTDGPALFDGRALAHPLLPRADAVANDVVIGGTDAALWLVSGSNMSGKSTLLRAVGLNAVLAQAGAPVCASSLAMTPLAVGGTLRIQDSLQEGRSRFFAEITRLQQIVSLARRPDDGPAVLFLLDELLSGTNSHDRRHGAAAILKGLVDLGAIGLATTHDLALATVVADLGPKARNVHFEDRFEDGVLHFDYRLRPGVVQGSNALALMRSVGLEV